MALREPPRRSVVLILKSLSGYYTASTITSLGDKSPMSIGLFENLPEKFRGVDFECRRYFLDGF